MSGEGGYELAGLMELAGLSVASAVHDYAKGNHLRILLLCGPGNNGGDGLVAARHLKQFGHTPTIAYPKKSSGQLFDNLVKQAKNAGIQIVQDPDQAINLVPQNGSSIDFDLIVDGLFGFSFTGPPRAPFDSMLSRMASSSVPVFSIDIPSGWSVDDSTPVTLGFYPSAVISLTAPKLCMKGYKGEHYLGLHKVLPPAMVEEFGLHQLAAFGSSSSLLSSSSSSPSSSSSSSSSQFIKLPAATCNDPDADANDTVLNLNASVITVTLMTAPSQTVATDIANRLVEQKLAACVNILPQMTSVYRWDGKVNVDSELLLVVKSDSSPLHLQALRDAVLEIHPYDTPEIIHLPVSAGLDKYIEWVKKETKTKDS